MNIFPAIDLYNGSAVRLFKGDYEQMTVYEKNAAIKAEQFESAGAQFLHLVDLNGARDGSTENFDTISQIVLKTSLKAQVGGGIRSAEAVEKYLSIGVMRVILGTAALENPSFLRDMLAQHGEKIAVGVDIKGEDVATHGWTKKSGKNCFEFIRELCDMGVKTLICTDISKDGAMAGTNLELYGKLSREYEIDIIASGGVSTLSDVRALREMELYGAILGRSIYTGGIDLAAAIEVAR